MSRVQFTSTRDPSLTTDFVGAMTAGQPRGGGLFVPVEIPVIDPDIWPSGRSGISVAELASILLPEWVGERIATQIDWAATFSFPIPLKRLDGTDDFDGLQIAELYHGPTGSFKDFGARFLAAAMSIARDEADRPALVVVATSGDTGSAVADAFSGRDGIAVSILYPALGVSEIQEAQLTQTRPGVRSIRVDGSFDDCQRVAKRVLASGLEDVDVISANSINVGRLIPQMLFYLSAAISVAQNGPRPAAPLFVVPCGNLGNLTAGLLARHFALPDSTFLAATNANDYFARIMQDWQSQIRPLVRTLSNAMDVAEPSNLERIRHLFPPDELGAYLSATSTDDDQTRTMIRRTYQETGCFVDPHTAVALHGFLQTGADRQESDVVVMSTADPAKFRNLVEEAAGAQIPAPRFVGGRGEPDESALPSEALDAVARVARELL